MLQRLYIENFAIVDNLEVEFGAGFTTITGETGAGKSIIMDAVSALIGDRISTDVIRHGESRAEVIGDINIKNNQHALNWLDAQQYDVDDTVIIRRIIAENGGRATLNGKPVTMGQLKEFGESLLEIHGQHAHQRLMRADSYREILDEFGNYPAELQAVDNAWSTLNGLKTRKQRLLKDTTGDIGETLSFLGFQIDELTQSELDTISHEELDTTINTLGHANDLVAGMERVQYVLGESEEGNARNLVAEAQGEIQKLLRYDESLKDLIGIFDQVDELLNELISDTRRRADNVSLDGEEFERLENLLTKRMDLARKHRRSPEELPQVLEQLQQRHDDLSSATEELTNIETEILNADTAYQEHDQALHDQRLRAAEAFGERISSEIEELGMGKANVKIEVTENAQPANKFGTDDVSFLIATNPGETHKPIHKIASGGELSRIALAIEVANAEKIHIPSMIFDEVDVGIGGATADIVGGKIKSLAINHQIICITHLPQVAAHGDHQFKVAKTHGDDETRVSINVLNSSERINELARMLGGREITPQTRQLAEELISKASLRQ